MKRLLLFLLAVFTAFSVYLITPDIKATPLVLDESPGWYRETVRRNVVDEITVGDKVYPIAEVEKYYSNTHGFRTDRNTYITKHDLLASNSYPDVFHIIELNNKIDHIYMTKPNGDEVLSIDVNSNLDYTKGTVIKLGVKWNADGNHYYYDFNGEHVEFSVPETVKSYILYYTINKKYQNNVIQDNNIIKHLYGNIYQTRDKSTKLIKTTGTITEITLAAEIDKHLGHHVYKLVNGDIVYISPINGAVTTLTLTSEISEYLGSLQGKGLFKLANANVVTIEASVKEINLGASVVSYHQNGIFKLSNNTYVYYSAMMETTTVLPLESPIESHFIGSIYKLENGDTAKLGSAVTVITLAAETDKHLGQNVYKLVNGDTVYINQSDGAVTTLAAEISEYLGNYVFKLANGDAVNIYNGTVTTLTLAAEIDKHLGHHVYKLVNGDVVYISLSDGAVFPVDASIKKVWESGFFEGFNNNYFTIYNGVVTEKIFSDKVISEINKSIIVLENGDYVTTSNTNISIPKYVKSTKTHNAPNGVYKKVEYMQKGTALTTDFLNDGVTPYMIDKTFNYYSLTENGSKVAVGTVIPEDFTLYVVLKDAKLPIKIHIGQEQYTVYYYRGESFELETPTKDGYLFSHWSLEDGGTETALVAGFTWTNVPKEFYAVFDKVFTVTFISEYEIIDEVMVKENERVVAPETPQKEGHKFVGWYKDADCQKVFKITDIITEDTQLYAKFVANDGSGGGITIPLPEDTNINLTPTNIILIVVGSVIALLILANIFGGKKRR